MKSSINLLKTFCKLDLNKRNKRRNILFILKKQSNFYFYFFSRISYLRLKCDYFVVVTLINSLVSFKYYVAKCMRSKRLIRSCRQGVSYTLYKRYQRNVTKGDAKEGVNVNVCDHPRTTYSFFFAAKDLLVLFFCSVDTFN